MIYSEFNMSTGLFTGKTLESNNINLIASNISPGHGVLEGSFNADIDRVDVEQMIPIIASGSVRIRYENKPDNPLIRWDREAEQWKDSRPVETVNLIETDNITTKRLKLLVDSDWTDTLSAKARLGESTYNEWQTYRQALRDITKQSGYPLDVTWPVPPQ